MKGLLHRMAARAAGTAVAVRSGAGLPYAAGGAVAEDVGEAKSYVATDGWPLAWMSSASSDHAGEPVVRPADLPIAADPARPPSPPVAAFNDSGAVRDTPLIASSATFAPSGDSTRPSSIGEPQLTMPSLPAAPQLPDSMPAAIERGAAVARAPREIAITAPTTVLASEPAPLMPREIAITARTAVLASEPAPLMPREPRPAPLAPVPQPAARRGASPQANAVAQPEADTEVHIHIGRIDVTAVHEAAPPRRRAAAAPAPMSLDDYLAQRGRS